MAKSDYDKWREEAIDCGGDFHKALQMLDVAIRRCRIETDEFGNSRTKEAIRKINAIAWGNNGS